MERKIKVLFAVPSYDGKLDHRFVTFLDEVRKEFTNNSAIMPPRLNETKANNSKKQKSVKKSKKTSDDNWFYDYLADVQLDIKIFSNMLIHDARNSIFKLGYEKGYDYVFMCDSDNWIEPKAVYEMFKKMNLGFCMGIVAKRYDDRDEKVLETTYNTRNIHILGAVVPERRQSSNPSVPRRVGVYENAKHDFGVVEPVKKLNNTSKSNDVVEVDMVGTMLVLYSKFAVKDLHFNYRSGFEFFTTCYLNVDLGQKDKNGNVVRDKLPLYLVDGEYCYKTKKGKNEIIQKLDKSLYGRVNSVKNGEDVFGHDRLKALGYKIYADYDTRGYHINSNGVLTEDGRPTDLVTLGIDNYEMGLTVVVPTYNNPDLLNNCLKNLVYNLGKYTNGKTYAYEIIVLDDCSPGIKDKNGKTVMSRAKLLEKQQQIIDNWNNICGGRILYKTFEKNYGVNTMRNMGVELASGKFVFVINNDIVIKKDTIEKLVSKLDDKTWISCPVSTNGERPFEGTATYNSNNIMGCARMIEKSNRKWLGFIPNGVRMFFGDDFLFRKTVDLGKKVVYSGDCIIHHFENATVGVIENLGEKTKNRHIMDERMRKIVYHDTKEWVELCEKYNWEDNRPLISNILKWKIN